MHVRGLRAVAALVVLASSCSAKTTSVSPVGIPSRVTARGGEAAARPAPAPVVLIVMENHSYGQIAQNAAAPYLNRFAERGMLLTRMHAITHPSLPNYLALTSGSTLGCTSDACPTRSFRVRNLFSQLRKHGVAWRAWEESMPTRCSLSDASPYAVRHDPPPYYRNLFPKACPRHDRPYPAPLPDRIPGFTFITPNLCHDMHDCSVATGDAWARSHVPPLLRRGAIVVITFDEGSGDNHIFCVVRGPSIPRGVMRPKALTHYGLLAGIERHFGLPLLGHAKTATLVPL
jgi:phosphatidylinositol-3-phosphatase